jgi:uncharacterized protein YkwD
MTSNEQRSREGQMESHQLHSVIRSAPTISVDRAGSSIIVPEFKVTLVPSSTASLITSSENNSIKELFDQANEMRAAKKVPPFTYDERLEKAAQKHADDLGTGAARPHAQLEWRIHTYAGFPDEPCHMSRVGMPANYSEGIQMQPSAIPLDQALPFLVNSGPGEGHYDDFFDPKVTHVGIGMVQDANGYYNIQIVLDYGILCNFKPEPTPAPKPDIDRDLFDVW